MFLIEKMELYPFSANESHIAEYLLKERYNIENKTSADIAKDTYSSKSALTRFAQKLDYKGWVDFKKAFLNELTYMDKQNAAVDANYPFSAKDDFFSIAHKIANLEKEVTDETLSLLDHSSLSRAVEIIDSAETVHIFAASNNLLNAQEFSHNLSRIQKDVRIHQLQGEHLFKAFLAKKESCALIISYSGETVSLKHVCRILKRQQIPIIALTSISDNTIAQSADCQLYLATREKLYSKIGTFSTDRSIAYLLDLLYACLFSLDYQHNADLRRNAARFIEFERTSSSQVLHEG
ncbi:MurR/RpiR family transcriptional regulator [Streptococcus sp. H49]|uniref:MurR/RpiR family transcriptional regulator n=1 Tax=Streptococcus huangxiaojuni TaxID=3237239 RepID=UPI0034A20674